ISLVYSSRSEDDHHVLWPQCREGALLPGVGEADSVSQLRRRPPARRTGMDRWFCRMQRLQAYESARCSRTNASTSSLLPLTANLPSGRTDARSRMSAYVGAETTT